MSISVWGLWCSRHEGSAGRFILIIMKIICSWTDACRKCNPYFKWSSRHLRSLIRCVFLQMTELAGINENVADDNMGRVCLLHVSLPHNYATTRSTDRLSSINPLRNTNRGLLYVVTSGCCLRHASWMSALLELHRHTSSDGKTLTFTYSYAHDLFSHYVLY